MKTLTVTEVARHFHSVLDEMERKQEDVMLVRNRRQIARLVPEPAAQNALELISDLCGVLDEDTANALAECVNHKRKSNAGKLTELSNPWAS